MESSKGTESEGARLKSSRGRLYWPESHGFAIAGSGPCYVISVSKKSEAYKAGISPGDQLIEVANHNVTDMSADSIKTLARHSSLQPPSISVVSKMQYIELLADRRWGYGFVPKGVKPTVIGSVDPPGPAYQAGLRAGDIVLEVNGKELKHPKNLEPILQTRYGRMTLGIVPMNIKITNAILHQNNGVKSMKDRSVHVDKPVGRVVKARNLFSKMNVLLGHDFRKKLTVVELLKKYSEDRRIEHFASSLNRVLKTKQERKLIDEIRPFIPMKQTNKFDEIFSCHPHKNAADTSSSHMNTLTVSTGSSQHSRYVNNYGHSAGGIGLLAIAKDTSKPRVLHVKRGNNGSFGFILRGHNPVCIESTVPRGSADKAGLKAGDQILKVNGIDVRKCSHDHLVRILQSSGETSVLEVVRIQPQIKIEKTRSQPQFIASPESHNSHKTTSSWLSDSGLTLDGHSFRDKVEMLLTQKEKMSIRLALIEYNMNRNIAQLVDDGNIILDTPAKRALWVFILHRLTKEHQNYVFKYVNIPKRYMQDVINKVSKFSKERTAEFLKSPSDTTDLLSSDVTEVTNDTLHSGNYHHGSFQQQLDYLLTSRERSQLQKALQIYRERKNVHHLLGDLSDILDTASKKTLWLYILPLLENKDKNYVQRVLGLPEYVPEKEPMKKGHVHSKGVLPKYGDILYLQNEFVGNFLQSRKKLNGYSSDEDVDDLIPEHDGSLTSDIADHTPTTLSSENMFGTPGYQRKPVLPLRGTFGQNVREPTYSSDVEQTTMVMNPIYAEIDHSAKTSPEINQHKDVKPKTKMVRESAAQTSPKSSPVHRQKKNSFLNGIPIHKSLDHNMHPDFKTVVKVYEQLERNPDIVAVCDTRAKHDEFGRRLHGGTLFHHENLPLYEEPVSSGTQYTNIDDVHLNGDSYYHSLNPPFKENLQQLNNNSKLESNGKHTSDFLDNAVGTPVFNSNSHSSHTMNSMSKGVNNLRSVSKQKPQVSPSNLHANGFPSYSKEQVQSTDSGGSMHKGDSYHAKAMNAIKELDNVVDKENYDSYDQDDDDYDSNQKESIKAVKRPAPAPPPPPLPDTKGPQNKASVRLNVKRINWEKIEQPQENTIWSKIDKDSDDLQDVVKYLELEQQFSTKTSKVSQTFLERRTENYILSPKKAYNIC